MTISKNKIDELHRNMGNALLYQLRLETENIKKAEKTKSKALIRQQYIDLLGCVKKALDKNYQSTKNMQEFEKLEKDIDRCVRKNVNANLYMGF